MSPLTESTLYGSSPLPRLKMALTLLLPSIVTAHDPEPPQAPDQPMKVKLAAGVAVKVTA
jgi:hypothetical protein